MQVWRSAIDTDPSFDPSFAAQASTETAGTGTRTGTGLQTEALFDDGRVRVWHDDTVCHDDTDVWCVVCGRWCLWCAVWVCGVWCAGCDRVWYAVYGVRRWRRV
jgi:hypothetical protein